MEGDGVGISARDIAYVVDPEAEGGYSAGDVEGGEDAAAEQEAVPAAGVVITAYNLVSIIDPLGHCGRGAGDIDGGERVLDIGHGRLHAAENAHSEQEQ